MTTNERDERGEWMQTIGGRRFFPLDPRPDDIDIEDIAHALSHVCRFGGHCRFFYSVAEHSVRVALAILASGGTLPEQLEGLLHDAAEAYVGDMVWPLKQTDAAHGYREIEKRIEHVIAHKFGLPLFRSPIVKRFDLVLLSTEKRDILNEGPGREDGAQREAESARDELGKWHSDDFAPLVKPIEPWSPEKARTMFLDYYDGLRKLITEGTRP